MGLLAFVEDNNPYNHWKLYWKIGLRFWGTRLQAFWKSPWRPL